MALNRKLVYLCIVHSTCTASKTVEERKGEGAQCLHVINKLLLKNSPLLLNFSVPIIELLLLIHKIHRGVISWLTLAFFWANYIIAECVLVMMMVLWFVLLCGIDLFLIMYFIILKLFTTSGSSLWAKSEIVIEKWNASPMMSTRETRSGKTKLE